MFAFATLFFFSFTGLTLNHTDWFGAQDSRAHEYRGVLNLAWLSATSFPNTDDPNATDNGRGIDSPENSELDSKPIVADVNRLAIAEFLRSTHSVKGAITNFAVDEYQCTIVFAGPGYNADVFVDRETGNYEIVELIFGAVAIMNDLHKGRDSGVVWKMIIDISAIICVLVSLTGLWLLFYIRGRWRSGLMTGLAGGVALVAIYLLFVP